MCPLGQEIAQLRQRSAVLLSRIPHHVRALHDELVATRTISRRILAEMLLPQRAWHPVWP